MKVTDIQSNLNGSVGAELAEGANLSGSAKFGSLVAQNNLDFIASFLLGLGPAVLGQAEDLFGRINGTLPRDISARDFQFADVAFALFKQKTGTPIEKTALPNLSNFSQAEFVKFSARIGQLYSDGKISAPVATAAMMIKLDQLDRAARSIRDD